MPKRSLSDDVAPVAGLRNTNEPQQHVNEVDQSGSVKDEIKHESGPSHEAQAMYGPTNDHDEVVLFKDEPESDKNDSTSEDDSDNSNNKSDSSDNDNDNDCDNNNDNINENEDMNENDDEDIKKEEDEDEDENDDGSITVNLSDIQKKFECPICLGIIRRTKAVQDCLHRFCKECIEKSLRVCKNECPVCGTYCASRRSLRDDPNYDNLISLFYPDISQYEEEEMTLDENEILRNQQIHASIAQTLQRQTEARKRKVRVTAEASTKRLQSTNGRAHLWRSCRNLKNAGEILVSNDNEDVNDDNDVGRGSSSAVEKTETRAQKGGEQAHFPQESFTIDADGTGDDNISNVNTEIINSYATLASGRNDQSNTGIDGKNAQSDRLSRIIDHLRNSNANDDELDIHLMLVSLDEQRIPSLQEPYLCCRPTLPVKTLKKYVALKVGLLADEVELCLVAEPQASVIRGEGGVVDPNKDKFCVLKDEETLAELCARNAFCCGYLLLAYKKK